MDVTINRNRITVPADFTTWGDLLDWIETENLKPGQCITHVFLGGDEEINYRTSTVCRQNIEAVGRIIVETGDFDTVVRESLEELDRELDSAVNSSHEIVRLLENRKEEAAYAELAHLLDSIRIFYTVFSEDLGWASVTGAETSREEFSAALEQALTQLVAAQENRYWVAICDVLEYEINPLLESWQKLVEGTRAQIA